MMKITEKEMEAVLYMLDNRPLMLDRLQGRWGRSKVQGAIDRLYDPVEEDRAIPEDLSDVERDVLRECVEGSIWLRPYVGGYSPVMLEEARETLRDLARKLEPVGVEINHIPHT